MKRWLSLVWRWTCRLALVSLVLGLVGLVVAALLYKRHVVEQPGEHIQRDAIMAIIAQESPVLYADGQTRIGVFFAQEHRDYVPFDRIPDAWVDAIVASEDQRFFDHYGLDPVGIGRAMRDNATARRVVAGGSSLTQQTAKNLYYRPDRSFRSKWEELVNALRLEAHHSKEDILEFYANQFHVSANGRGLGIAARYFFDKEVEELGVLECAFLAGMVKAPATYNPFLGTSQERQTTARQRARDRTRYVLDRMLVTGALSQAEHAALIEQEIPFVRGTFRYDTHVILDEVAARLERAPFPELFAELGIDNPSTAGIQVVTTVDHAAQQGATWALWHHLTEVGPLMEGGAEGWAGAAAFRLPDSRSPKHDPHDPPERWAFRTGVVTGAASGKHPTMLLDLGGHDCVVDADGLRRAATVVARAEKGESWRQAKAAEVDSLIAALEPGSVVWISVTDVATDDAPARCELELRPELQGAAVVLQDGRIRAMVGGNDNKDFNRVVTARRQLGSTWKPVLYFAALHLGWAPTDVLDNRPGQAFRFEGSWYYPRPDHESEPFVSLGWAGTRSENVASIWLLAHLVDRLDDAGLHEVAAAVDLAPREGEERGAWIRRIRDDWGIISTEERLPEVAFYAVRGDVVAELLEADQVEEAQELSSLIYGSGARAEEGRLARQRGAADKLASVRFNLLRLEELSDACQIQATALQRAMDRGGTLRVDEVPDLRLRPWAGALQLGCGDVGEGWAVVGEHLLAAIGEGVRIPLGSTERMLIDGRLHAETLVAVRRAMTRQVLVLRQADPWSLDVLVHHPDYRQLLGMRYLALLARRLGVAEDLPPVLSLPLGAVDISLEEVAGLYQGMQRGEAWVFPGEARLPGGVAGSTRTAAVSSPERGALLIAEIRDRDGRVLYQVQPEPITLTETAPGRLTGDILRNVVRHGTGRRANGTVTLAGRPVPVAGKTGTTNSYRNAAFVGFVPRAVAGPEGPQWRWGEGFTVATYVGYDDNREMRRGSVRLQGASGALPVWIGAAQALADSGLLGTTPPSQDEWQIEDGFELVPVSGGSGLPLTDGETALGDPGRAILVARRRGLLGLGQDLLRVVAPVAAGGSELDLVEAIVPVLQGEEEDLAEEEVPGEEGEVLDPEAVEPPSEEAELSPPPADDPDAVRAWLGELLDAEPDVAEGEPAAPEGSPELVPVDPPSGEGPDEASDSGVIVPRIMPRSPSTDPR